MEEKKKENIEARIDSGAYTTLEHLIHDIDTVASSHRENSDESTLILNGEHTPNKASDNHTDGDATLVLRSLDKLFRRVVLHRPTLASDTASEDCEVSPGTLDSDNQERSRVLILRSQTEKGPRHLFTGLQGLGHGSGITHPAFIDPARSFTPIDPDVLPNGITPIDSGPLHLSRRSKELAEKRTIGDVFKPHRSLKPLEPPRQARNVVRNNQIRFTKPEDLDIATPIYKGDYKFASLPTGQWLQYSKVKPIAQSESGIAKRLGGETAGNDTISTEGRGLASAIEKNKTLFRAAYSSFTPTSDNSAAVIPERTRGETWWDRTGSQLLQSLISSMKYPETDLDGTTFSLEEADNFDSVVSEFVPDDTSLNAVDGRSSLQDDQKEAEDILTEISELLQTLSSYQRIRNLAPASPGSSHDHSAGALLSIPSDEEKATYELLKLQLKLTIEALPPFAVAKLYGDQLQTLNVNTKLMVPNFDYPGSMEPDELTMQRRRTAQPPLSAVNRAAAPPTRQTSYQTPGSAINYQRAYAANTIRPQYPPQNRPFAATPTPTQSHQGPRPSSSTSHRPSYGQQTFPQGNNTPGYPQTPNLQQFQRPLQNGYGNYSTNSSPFTQRPSQPGYQQRAQDLAQSFARSASPQNTMTNGQPFYSQRQTQPGYGAGVSAGGYNSSDQQAAIERAKLAAQQHAQRQKSGTPQAQDHGSDGAIERRETPNGVAAIAGGA